MASVVLFAGPAAGAAGDVDATFGSAGTTTWDPSPSDETIRAVTHQADGRIVSAGYVEYGIFAVDDADALLSRHNGDGTLDTSFGGGDGVVVSDFGDYDGVRAIAVQPDGKIVVAGCVGSSTCSFGSAHLVARYNHDGTPDTSFGNGTGFVVFDTVGGNEWESAYDVMVEDSGRIITAGLTSTDQSAAGNDMALVAFDADGTVDTSFGGGDGVVVTDFGGRDMAKGMVRQPDGRIVVAGHGSGAFGVARYLADGTPDPTFSGDGKLRTDFGGQDSARDVAIDTDGRIVVAGRGGSDGRLAVARFMPNGDLDPNFSGDGKATAPNYLLSTHLEVGIGVGVQVDGKIVAGGYKEQSGFGIARFTAAGALDVTFSGDGVAKDDLPYTQGNALSMDTAGDFVVAGSRIMPYEAMMMRFQGDLAGSACPGMAITNTVRGTPGDDLLVGTAGSDFIYGLGGNDTITAGDGNDCIYAGSGDDTVDAGKGMDRLFAESGNDTVTGATGLDKVVAGLGDDHIRISAGDAPASSVETLEGKPGTDTVELVGPALTAAHVSGSPPSFTVTDPTTGATYRMVNVELITDT